VFRVADDQGLALPGSQGSACHAGLCGGKCRNAEDQYGNISAASVGAIQRQLLVLDNQGATEFFGEPAFQHPDLMRVDRDGRGFVNILAADKLMTNRGCTRPSCLAALGAVRELPEAAISTKPSWCSSSTKPTFCSPTRRKRCSTRSNSGAVIRSKGVGVYFVTQNPPTCPTRCWRSSATGAARVARLHAARPEGGQGRRRHVPGQPKLDTATVITSSQGERWSRSWKATHALDGRAMHDPPPSARLGTVTPERAAGHHQKSSLRGKYEQTLDHESAFEMLQKRTRIRRRRAAPRRAPRWRNSGASSAVSAACWAVCSAPPAARQRLSTNPGDRPRSHRR